MLLVEFHGRLAGERRLAGQALVERDRRRVDVGGRAGFRALELLGRHVPGGPGRHRPVPGQGGDAEVGQLARAVGVHEHIRQLVVPVDYAALVRRRQSEQRPVQHHQGTEDRGLALALQDLRQRDPVDQLHYDRGAVRALDVLVQPDHERGVQPLQRRRLRAEQRGHLRVAEQSRVQVLDRDLAAGGVVGGQDHLAEPAPAQQPQLGVAGHGPGAPRLGRDGSGDVSSWR